MWKTTSAPLTRASLDLCILMGPQSCRRQVSLLNDCFVSQLCWRASKGCGAGRHIFVSSFFLIPLSGPVSHCVIFWLKVITKKFWPQLCYGICFDHSPQSLRSNASEWHIWEYLWYLKSDTNFTSFPHLFKHKWCNLAWNGVLFY